MNKNTQGKADFEAQAINTSGGNSPNTVSETKKNKNITCGENDSTRLLSSELISKKKYSSPNTINTKKTIAIPPLNAVFLRNE